MQLPRAIIAAVFLAIAAILLTPQVIRWTSQTSASEEPTGLPSGSGRPSGLATTQSGSPSPSRTSPSPRRSSPSTRPASPPPSTSRGPIVPVADPLSVNIGSVSCPGRTVRVTVANTSSSPQDYTVETDDGSASRGGTVPARGSRTTVMTLREDRRTRISVTWRNEPVREERHTANCVRPSPSEESGPTEEPEPTRSPDRLPRTGPDSAMWARTATGVGALVTGLIVFWYGGIWPRRRDAEVFGRKNGR